VSDVNPVSHLVTATRTLMAGTATAPKCSGRWPRPGR
jgi:hypothetical protein